MPIYGFGTSTRDNRRKVFVSQGHNKDLFGVGSPVRHQARSHRRPAAFCVALPRVCVGASLMHPSCVLASQGPSAYVLKPAVGKQVSSKRASTPSWVFGSESR